VRNFNFGYNAEHLEVKTLLVDNAVGLSSTAVSG